MGTCGISRLSATHSDRVLSSEFKQSLKWGWGLFLGLRWVPSPSPRVFTRWFSPFDSNKVKWLRDKGKRLTKESKKRLPKTMVLLHRVLSREYFIQIKYLPKMPWASKEVILNGLKLQICSSKCWHWLSQCFVCIFLMIIGPQTDFPNVKSGTQVKCPC